MSQYFLSSSAAYFDTEGRRKGYDIDDVDFLMQAKYGEAQLQKSRIQASDQDQAPGSPDDSAVVVGKGNTAEKKLIIKAIEAFQESDRESDQERKIYKRRRKSSALDVGKALMKWKNIQK